MKNKAIIGLSISMLILSGCWDRRELNDRAIWLATGWDVAEDGNIEISGQIMIPANLQTQSGGGGGGGGAGLGFFTISAKGRNISDALQSMQEKLPREAFFGQRRVTFFGEEFAKQGLKKEIDVNSRIPGISLRGDIFVVKDGTAKEILTKANPLEKSPALTSIKEHRQSGGRGDTSYVNFLIASNRDGIRPSIPIIDVTSSLEGAKSGKDNSPNPEVLRLAGVGVFDRNLKMLGALNTEENRDLLWVMGFLKKMIISISQQDDNGSNASIQLTKISSKIEPMFTRNNEVRFTVSLKGEGRLEENNSGLDLTDAKNLRLLEKKFEAEAQKRVQSTITRVQEEYGMDIFGFGETVHRNNPTKWKSLKSHWDETFPETEIIVKANVKIKQIGMDGPSILFRESELEK